MDLFCRADGERELVARRKISSFIRTRVCNLYTRKRIFTPMISAHMIRVPNCPEKVMVRKREAR